MSLVNVAYCIYFIYNGDEKREFRSPVAEVYSNSNTFNGMINQISGEDFREVRREVFMQYGSRVNREAICNEPPGELTEEEWNQLFTSVALHEDGRKSHEHTFEIYN